MPIFAEKFILTAFAALLLSSCGRSQAEVPETENVLVTYGDSSLMESEVVERIPVGLSEADSLEMFLRIADSWVEDMALSDVAEANSQSVDRIDRLVADYRNQLIVSEYLKNMSAARTREITESDVKRYFDRNRNAMKLDEPLVKGIYIKMPSRSGKLGDVRRWMQKGNESAVDNIEKYCLDEVAQYEYFGDRWIEWSGVTEQIPHRFSDPDSFLSTTKDFETEYGDSRYLLHIIDYLPSGSEMPYQYASAKIREIIGKENAERARRELLHGIYRAAVNDGRLRPEGYDPVSGRIVKRKK